MDFFRKKAKCSRRRFLKTAGLASISLGISGLSAGQVFKAKIKQTAKPNIIIILSDDAGYADFGITGSKQIPTPNIDKLAHNGVFCSQGYVTASVCTPSRMGLITGRYQQRFGAECNVPTIPTPGFTNKDLGIDINQQTLGNVLKAQGYRTMAVGKWHLGELDQYHPNNRGFDEFYGFLGGSRSYWPKNNPSIGQAVLNNSQPVNEEEEIQYITDDFTDAALEFIDEQKDQPFFIYLAYNAVHTPMHAKQEDIEQYSVINNNNRRILAAMTRSMDENIGRLMSRLDELQLKDNTLVIFLNDNGGAANNASSNLPLRGCKGTYWEGGIRVPFIFSWPSRVQKDITYEAPVSSLDLLPTCLAAAGGKIFADWKLDGVNLLPYLQGKKKETPHEFLFWRLWRVSAVRQGPWKLLRTADDPLKKNRELLLPLALFNLDKDPGETINLAEQNPDKTKELLEALEKWELSLEKPRWYDGSKWKHWQDASVENHRVE